MALPDPVYGPGGDQEQELDYSDEEEDPDRRPPPDEGEEGPQVYLVPAMLESTEERENQARIDRIATRGTRCTLCELGFHTDVPIQCKFTELVEFYEKNRRKIRPEILYEIIRDRYNNEIYRRRRERLREGDAQPIMLAQIRRHFEDNHDQVPAKALEDQLAYMRESATQMQKTALWVRNQNDPEAKLMLNPKGWDVYMRLTSQIATIVQRLGVEERGDSFASSRVGKGNY